eukprot:gene15898-33498_t
MSLPVRLGLFYSAIFIGVGAGSPYMPLWFAERGLSGAQIGLILSLPMIARVVDNVLASGIRPVLVVTGHLEAEIRAAIGGRPVTFVHAARHAEGLAESLKAGIAA